MDTDKTTKAKANNHPNRKGIQKTKDLVSQMSAVDLGQLAITLEQNRSADVGEQKLN